MDDATSGVLQRCLDRALAGEAAARDELFRLAGARLERLARVMLRDFPRVRRWEETADVVQNALVRLCRALTDVRPATVRDFYRLAAVQIRRELIDLARHHYGPHGGGAHHHSQGGEGGAADAPPAWDTGDASLDPGRVALWTDFHRQVDLLPDEQREVFDLLFYQGLSQDQAAELIGVSTRTIKTRWREARLRLHDLLGGALPGLS
ncbi:MAG: sigma-70 family RNA polymerase sigma factor [Gemmataceae bacterium]